MSTKIHSVELGTLSDWETDTPQQQHPNHSLKIMCCVCRYEARPSSTIFWLNGPLSAERGWEPILVALRATHCPPLAY